MKLRVTNITNNEYNSINTARLIMVVNNKRVDVVVKESELIIDELETIDELESYYKAIMLWFSKVPNLKHRVYKYDDCEIKGNVMKLLLENVKVIKNHHEQVDKEEFTPLVSCLVRK